MQRKRAAASVPEWHLLPEAEAALLQQAGWKDPGLLSTLGDLDLLELRAACADLVLGQNTERGFEAFVTVAQESEGAGKRQRALLTRSLIAI